MREKLELRSNKYSIQIGANQILGIRTTETIARAVRIFEEGKLGTAVAKGDTDFQVLIQEADADIDLGLEYDYKLPSKNIYFRDYAADFSEMELSDLHETSKEILSFLIKNFPDYLFNNSISYATSSTLLENSLGVSLYKREREFQAILLFKEKGSPNLIDGYIYYNTARDIDLAPFYKYCFNFFKAFSEEIEINSKKYPIVFTEPFIQRAILSKFFHALNGKNYYEGVSLLSNKIGEKIFSNDFTLLDTALLPEFGITNPFDLEGSIREDHNLILIKNGVLKAVALDLATAAKYGKKTTGNGYRTYRSNPKIGFNLLNIKPSIKPLNEILRNKTAIVPIMMSGGDYTDKGDFASPVQLALVYKNGKLIGKANQIQISGNFFHMFNKDFMGSASDRFISYSPTTPFVIEMEIKAL